MPRLLAAEDGEHIRSRSHGQDWIVSWHPPSSPPPGTPHGAAGLCFTADDQLVLISHDGRHWGFPAGRPEADESAADTLRREVLEEACAFVVSSRLLGFASSRCVRGPQRDVVLVRSYWYALVDVAPWEPKFEVRHRRLIAACTAMDQVRDPEPAATRISYRALRQADAIRMSDGGLL